MHPLTINALPLCFLLADGTFVAATVYGGNCKVFPGVPGADRGIYVFGSLYALRQYISGLAVSTGYVSEP